MVKIKKLVFVATLLLITAFLCLTFCAKSANAETNRNDGNNEIVSEGAIAPYGLFTKLNYSLDGNGGRVWFAVKNEFTLFPATVEVYVYLYKSDTFTENYSEMELAISNYTQDLDQGKRVSAEVSTNGVQCYWKGRAYYNIDKGGWKEYLSETVLFNADGVRV